MGVRRGGPEADTYMPRVSQQAVPGRRARAWRGSGVSGQCPWGAGDTLYQLIRDSGGLW